MTTRAPRPDQRTALTEVVDARTGVVRASGHLTVQGADLLRGAVESLHRSGHARVLLDLRHVQAADVAGLHVLHDVACALAEVGGTLLVSNAPEPPTKR
jgi:anti-anti-sigma regulatory factor